MTEEPDVPARSGVELSPSLSVYVRGGSLIAEVRGAESLANPSFAFYLIQRREKVASRWYQSDSMASFALPEDSAQLQIAAFIRPEGDATSIVLRSEILDVGYLVRLEKFQLPGPHIVEIPDTAFNHIVGGSYAQLKSAGFKARPDSKPVPLTVPMQWTGHKDRNLEFMLCSWRMLGPVWVQYRQTRDVVLLREAMAHMFDWLRWVEGGSRSTFAWYDMAVGVRASHLGFILNALRLAEAPLDEADKRRMAKLVQLHLDKLLSQSFIKNGNHAVHQIIGLRLLCAASGHGTPENDAYCERNLRQLLEDSFDEHGVHKENSPAYHLYVLNLFRTVPQSLFPATAPQISSTIRKATAVTPWLTDPGGSFYQIGDTEGPGIPLTRDDLDPLSDARDRWISKDLSASGYVVVRSHPDAPAEDRFALVFHATAVSDIHAHADHLSFVLTHRGQELIVDSGKHSYDIDRWRSYFAGDAAHNTIGIKGLNIQPEQVRLPMTSLGHLERLQSGDFAVMGTTVKGGEHALAHQRHLVVAPGRSIIIEDQCSGLSDGLLEYRLHVAPGMSAVRVGSTVRLARHGATYAVITFLTEPADLQLVTGQDDTGIQGWTSRKYRARDPSPTVIAHFARDTRTIVSRIDLLS